MENAAIRIAKSAIESGARSHFEPVLQRLDGEPASKISPPCSATSMPSPTLLNLPAKLSIAALALLGLLGGSLIVAHAGFETSPRRGGASTFVPVPEAYILSAVMYLMSCLALLVLLRDRQASTTTMVLAVGAYVAAAWATGAGDHCTVDRLRPLPQQVAPRWVRWPRLARRQPLLPAVAIQPPAPTERRCTAQATESKPAPGSPEPPAPTGLPHSASAPNAL